MYSRARTARVRRISASVGGSQCGDSSGRAPVEGEAIEGVVRWLQQHHQHGEEERLANDGTAFVAPRS